MSENKELYEAPLPWSVGDEWSDFAVRDANGYVVASIAARFYRGEDLKERGKKPQELSGLICRAVNDYAEIQALRRKAVASITIANGLAMAVLRDASASKELKLAASEALEAVKQAAQEGPRMEIAVRPVESGEAEGMG